MKKFLVFVSLAVIFLFSFTLINGEDEKPENTGNEADKNVTSMKMEKIEDAELENAEKLDFSKIKTSNENPDFDAHAGLD